MGCTKSTARRPCPFRSQTPAYFLRKQEVLVGSGTRGCPIHPREEETEKGAGRRRTCPTDSVESAHDNCPRQCDSRFNRLEKRLAMRAAVTRSIRVADARCKEPR
jgi:hypothetical protein